MTTSHPTLTEEQLKSILDRVQSGSQAADNKVNILTAVQAAVFAYILPGIADWLHQSGASFSMRGSLIVGAILLTIGIGASLSAIFPRTKNSRRKKSLTFFRDIASMKVDEYATKLRAATASEREEDYIAQIHINAVIATAKHRHFKTAVVLFASGLSILGLCYVVSLAGGW